MAKEILGSSPSEGELSNFSKPQILLDRGPCVRKATCGANARHQSDPKKTQYAWVRREL